MDDSDFMLAALQQARLAADAGEVPVGAVLVHQGMVIATGRNAAIAAQDPTAHAEVLALRAAAKSLGNYRLQDCELFVTLEPCAMCAGAVLHSRLKRVVFGAPDPKTGAAGSVLDLFARGELNHQTQVQGGVLAAECAALLQTFFQGRREQARRLAQPLREDALRTPDARFAALTDYPWQAHYVSDLPSLAGLRLHYLDEGAGAPAQSTYLCLHGPQAWSYQYRHQMADWLQQGSRVVAPDLIGFGKSDKPKKGSIHQWPWHVQVLQEWVQCLDLRHIVLVAPHWGGLLGLAQTAPERYVRSQLAPDLLADLTSAAYEAPFPDAGHRAALRALCPPPVPSMRYSKP